MNSINNNQSTPCKSRNYDYLDTAIQTKWIYTPLKPQMFLHASEIQENISKIPKIPRYSSNKQYKRRLNAQAMNDDGMIVYEDLLSKRKLELTRKMFLLNISNSRYNALKMKYIKNVPHFKLNNSEFDSCHPRSSEPENDTDHSDLAVSAYDSDIRGEECFEKCSQLHIPSSMPENYIHESAESLLEWNTCEGSVILDQNILQPPTPSPLSISMKLEVKVLPSEILVRKSPLISSPQSIVSYQSKASMLLSPKQQLDASLNISKALVVYSAHLSILVKLKNALLDHRDKMLLAKKQIYREKEFRKSIFYLSFRQQSLIAVFQRRCRQGMKRYKRLKEIFSKFIVIKIVRMFVLKRSLYIRSRSADILRRILFDTKSSCKFRAIFYRIKMSIIKFQRLYRSYVLIFKTRLAVIELLMNKTNSKLVKSASYKRYYQFIKEMITTRIADYVRSVLRRYISSKKTLLNIVNNNPKFQYVDKQSAHEFLSNNSNITDATNRQTNFGIPFNRRRCAQILSIQQLNAEVPQVCVPQSDMCDIFILYRNDLTIQFINCLVEAVKNNIDELETKRRLELQNISLKLMSSYKGNSRYHEQLKTNVNLDIYRHGHNHALDLRYSVIEIGQYLNRIKPRKSLTKDGFSTHNPDLSTNEINNVQMPSNIIPTAPSSFKSSRSFSKGGRILK